MIAAEEAQFDVFLTTDKNMRYQHNLNGRAIAIVLLCKQQWPELRLHGERIASVVGAARKGSYTEIDFP